MTSKKKNKLVLKKLVLKESEPIKCLGEALEKARGGWDLEHRKG